MFTFLHFPKTRPNKLTVWVVTLTWFTIASSMLAFASNMVHSCVEHVGSALVGRLGWGPGAPACRPARVRRPLGQQYQTSQARCNLSLGGSWASRRWPSEGQSYARVWAGGSSCSLKCPVVRRTQVKADTKEHLTCTSQHSSFFQPQFAHMSCF